MKAIYLFITIMCLNYFDVYCNIKIDQSVILVESPITQFDTNLIDWRIFLLDLLKDNYFFDSITSNSTVLVNITRNTTNSIFQTIKITNILMELITENTKKYYVINMEQMYRVYRELEISSEEISNSYEFSVKLANYLNADYIIYSIIYEHSKKLYLELQLMLSKTGEIIRTIKKSI